MMTPAAMKSALLAAAVVLACGGAPGALALDIDPADYVPLPVGTNLALGYVRLAHADRLTLKSGERVPASGLDSMLNLAAYARYFDVGGVTVAARGYLPYGRYVDGEAGGASLPAAGGMGDPFAVATAWLVNRPAENRYFGVTAFVFAPWGDYQPGRLLNIGENRWKGGVQAGAIYGLAPNWSAELTADVTLHGDNRRAGDGRQTLAQRRSFQLQPWLRYNFDLGTALSLGYSASFGGAQSLDGVPNGLSSQRHAVKLDYRQFVSDTLQFAATLSRDVAAEGGFGEAFRLNLRVMKLF